MVLSLMDISGSSVRAPLRNSFWPFLKPLCNLGLVPDFFIQRSEAWELLQSGWYRRLTISSVAVKEGEATDVGIAELLNMKKESS